jgi:hypothetical protein
MMPNALPAEVRSKLSALQVQRVGAEDGARSANTRLNSLPRDADPHLVRGLTQERDKHSERHRALSLLINKLNEFVMQLPANAVLEPIVIVDVDPKKGETLPTVLDRVRAEITAINERLATVRRAPLPPSDQKRLAEEYVERLARQARPTVGVVKDTLRVGWRDSIISSTDDLLPVLAWCCPNELRTALLAAIDEQPVPIAPMRASERQELEGKLSALLEQRELLEESLVQKMHAQGLVDTMRRVDIANLGVVLGVTLARKAQASQVA